ncbi:MAG: hypothetical protein E6201_02765 [Haemophilus parainfluenzae]|jgi:hypothetical protein|nr:hypothetical protein [Haemophilus parainfluenzae]
MYGDINADAINEGKERGLCKSFLLNAQFAWKFKTSGATSDSLYEREQFSNASTCALGGLAFRAKIIFALQLEQSK